MMCFSGVLSGHGPDVTIPATLWLANFRSGIATEKGFYRAHPTSNIQWEFVVRWSHPRPGLTAIDYQHVA